MRWTNNIGTNHVLIDYLEHGKLLSELWHKIEVQWRTSRFFYYKGTFTLKSLVDHIYILAATNYFFKWLEAIA